MDQWHIIVWMGGNEQTDELIRGLKNHPRNRALILCASSAISIFQEQNYDASEIPGSEDEWRKKLTALAHKAASNTPVEEIMTSIVISVMLTPETAGQARETIRRINKAAQSVSIAKFLLHIIAQADTVSPYAEEEKAFLASLSHDAKQYHLLKIDMEKQKKDRYLVIDNKYKEIQNGLNARQRSGENVGHLVQEAENEKAKEKEEARRELENRVQLERNSLLRWNLLSILSDHTESGAAEPKIRQYRTDILSGVALMNLDFPENQIPQFQCVGYSVQRSEFTFQDALEMPKYLLYEKLRSGSKNLSRAKNELPPEESEYGGMLEEIKRNTPRLWSGLLVDDNNYPSRSGNTLIQEFISYNPAKQFVGEEINSGAQAWLARCKRWLASQIVVDPAIKKYIQDEKGMDTLRSALEAKIQSVKASMEDQFSGSFGSRESLRKRKGNAKLLAEKQLPERLEKEAEIACLCEMQEHTGELKAFLDSMEKENGAYFGQFSQAVTDAFRENGKEIPWMKQAMEAVKRFSIDQIHASDRDTENYGGWLKNALRGYFQSLPDMEEDNVRITFPTVARKYVDSAAICKMLDARYGGNTRKETLDSYFLGASGRQYQLRAYSWSIDTVHPEELFTFQSAATNAADRTPDAPVPPSMEMKDVGANMDIQWKFDERQNVYTVTWNWFRGITHAAVTITDSTGEIEYCRETVQRETGKLEIKASKLPNNADIWINVTDSANQFQEKKETTKNLRTSLTPRIVKRSLSSWLSQLDVWEASLGSGGTPGFQVTVEYGKCKYHYPIPKKKNKMFLLSEHGQKLGKVYVELKGEK